MFGLIRQPWLVLLAALFLSVLLSCWISSRETVINTDAICYLQSAAMMQTSVHDAIHLCDQAKWPFYSMLIFALTQLLPLTLTVSAYILNALFSLIAIVTFILIVRLFTQNTIILWLAAGVILFAHEFNSVKHYIIRDHGYWAFYLISLWCLLNYFRQPKLKFALGWGVSLFVATLFRVEGAVFLLTLPVVVFLQRDLSATARVRSFFTLHGLTLVAALMLLLWLNMHPEQSLLRLTEFKGQFISGMHLIVQNLQIKSAVLGQQILGSSGMRDAGPVLTLTLMIWYVVNVISNVSVIYAMLIFYAWRKKLIPWTAPDRLVVYAYIAVNLIVTSMFFAENLFLSKRYLIALSLVLMLWVPFAIYHLMTRKTPSSRPVVIVVSIFIFISAIGGIVNFGYSKAYLRDSGDWLANHVPASATIYTNHYEVMYYSKHFGNDIFAKWHEFSTIDVTQADKWRKFDYLALYSDKHSRLFNLNLTPAQVFKNKRGDQVAIYKINSVHAGAVGLCKNGE